MRVGQETSLQGSYLKYFIKILKYGLLGGNCTAYPLFYNTGHETNETFITTCDVFSGLLLIRPLCVSCFRVAIVETRDDQDGGNIRFAGLCITANSAASVQVLHTWKTKFPVEALQR